MTLFNPKKDLFIGLSRQCISVPKERNWVYEVRLLQPSRKFSYMRRVGLCQCIFLKKS